MAEPKPVRLEKSIGLVVQGNTRRILNCLPSKNVESDWRFGHAKRAGLVVDAFPQSKDLRESWWDIGDQGVTGACVGWATADGVLRWHLVKGSKIGKPGRLSVRYVWTAAKETDEFTSEPTTFIESDGTSLKAALDVARKYGVVAEDVLPFASALGYVDEVEVFYAIASKLKIANYVNLGRDLNRWRSWLACNGPILTRLDVDDTWMKADATGKLQTYLPETVDGGHAVTLVGYDKDMFIVRNSWGTKDWGDQGFAYASDAYATAAFTEAYGVTVT